jgi:hypothetical protein
MLCYANVSPVVSFEQSGSQEEEDQRATVRSSMKADHGMTLATGTTEQSRLRDLIVEAAISIADEQVTGKTTHLRVLERPSPTF